MKTDTGYNFLRVKWIAFCTAILFCLFFSAYASQATENTASSTATTTQLHEITDINEVLEGFLFRADNPVLEEILQLPALPELLLPIPILFDVSPYDIINTWGHTRSNGRRHEGADIISPKGSVIISPTKKAVVTKIGYDQKGGNYIITANPGGEQFYYAHLATIAKGILPGKELSLGDVIGTVGNSGNAKKSGSHLHFGIYYKGVALDPHVRFLKELSLEDKLKYLDIYLNQSNTGLLTAVKLVEDDAQKFENASAQNIALPKIINAILNDKSIITKTHALDTKISLGSVHNSIGILQQFLMDEKSGAHAARLSQYGATNYFGEVTKNALAEYQKKVGITPALGYFGPITKSKILSELYLGDLHNTDEKNGSGQKMEKTTLTSLPYTINKDLEVGSEGDHVKWLQSFLIDVKIGIQATALTDVGATGYFGNLTKLALAEFQKNAGIKPATGYFGPITRSYISALLEI